VNGAYQPHLDLLKNPSLFHPVCKPYNLIFLPRDSQKRKPDDLFADLPLYGRKIVPIYARGRIANRSPTCLQMTHPRLFVSQLPSFQPICLMADDIVGAGNLAVYARYIFLEKYTP
jgi:hypothetical protein